MISISKPLRASLAITLAAAVVVAAFFASPLVHLPKGSFFPSSFVTHSVFLVLSLALMTLFSRGKLAEYGFTFGSFRLSWDYFAWVVPVLLLGLMEAAGNRSGKSANMLGMTNLQVVVFVWFYASICEEVLTRGLLQTLLERSARVENTLRRWLNLPVVVSGLFFGAMHLILLRSMGAQALLVVAFATYVGLVAAHYRQKTGSLAPPILLHMLFNIAGSLPLWIVLWLRKVPG